MKTEHLYYTELKEDLMQAGGLKPAASAADDFWSKLAACQENMRRERLAHGDGLPLHRFAELAASADQLAARMGLDFVSDLSGDRGMISLTAPSIFICCTEEADFVLSLTMLIQQAAQIDFGRREQCGEPLICLSFFFDLIV